ncbi:Putative Cytoplasmic protein [Rhizopus microsporus]|nr:Putative Cytoplasmic protein [Rhizopus microsporus]
MSSENLTNLAKPTSDATITVRCIKNFEYRTCKNLVLQHVNLETCTAGDLKKLVLEKIHTQPGWKPYLNVKFDTLKVYTVAHGHKTMNLIINTEDDDKLILSDDSAVLAWQGIGMHHLCFL